MSEIRRREFMALFGGATVWPLAARGQQAAVPVVGFVSGRSIESSARFGAVFRKALDEAGYVEGHNVMVEYLLTPCRGQRATSRTKGSHRNLGGLVSGRQRRVRGTVRIGKVGSHSR